MIDSTPKEIGAFALDFSQLGVSEEVARESGVNHQRCFHCGTCANACPFLPAMDYAPHVILRLLHMGLWRDALSSSTIWVCVGCQTCSAACPMSINIPLVMEALRQMALDLETPVPEPDILTFHRELLNSIERHGRTHKLEIMMRFKLSSGHWLSDVDLGIKMMAKRKLDLRPSKIEALDEVRRCFKKAWAK